MLVINELVGIRWISDIFPSPAIRNGLTARDQIVRYLLVGRLPDNRFPASGFLGFPHAFSEHARPIRSLGKLG